MRLLLVTPAFHGYWRSIAGALRRRGHDVRTHVYDALDTPRAKLRGKIRYELADRVRPGRGTARQGADLTRLAVAAVREHRPGVVVVIKGDALGPALWEALTGTPTVLWLYDELRRTRHQVADLRRADRVVTYSRLDHAALSGQGLDVTYLPNAFDQTVAFTPLQRRELVFVGARYPDREEALVRLHRAGVPVRAYGRDWSHHWVDRLRTWQLTRPDVPAERDVDRATGYGVVAGAAAAVNLHTDQDGFTMRTFEVPGCGGLQLIDRPDVAEFYDPGTEVVVFDGLDELVDLGRRAIREPEWAERIGRRGRQRTLAEHTFDHRAQVLETLWA
ncbi:MAG: glycosyltransferase [Pseudonocardia sp.]